jgi:CRISPR-associated endonuclease Cas2
MGKVKIVKEKVISSIVDTALLSLFFGIGFAGSGVANQRIKTEKTIDEMFTKVNYESIKRALRYLKRKGLVNFIKEENNLPIITAQGRLKLESLIPKYNETRTWDNRIYLVIYDIPKEKNTVRNYLRDYLIKIGCGKLQDSVWLTPYNPKKLIEEFVEKYNLDLDSVIISSIGKDGTIGDLDLSDLVEKVYKIREINQKYEEYLISNNPALYINTLSIDPQLPFELLPSYWVGDDAFTVFKNLTN